MIRIAWEIWCERRVHDLLAHRGELPPLDAARHLEHRFGQARAEILFLDQAGQEIGFAGDMSGLNIAAE